MTPRQALVGSLLALGAVALGFGLGRAQRGPRARGPRVVDAGFALPRAGLYRVRVRVTDAEGKPAPEMEVRALRAAASPCNSDGALPSATTDNAGRAEVTVPAPGTYRLEAVRGCGDAYGRVEGVKIGPGEPAEVDVHLEGDAPSGAYTVASLRLADCLLDAPGNARFEARLHPAPADWPYAEPPEWVAPGPYDWSLLVPTRDGAWTVQARLSPAEPHCSLLGVGLRARRAGPGERDLWTVAPDLPEEAVRARRWITVRFVASIPGEDRIAAATHVDLALVSRTGEVHALRQPVTWYVSPESQEVYSWWWVDPAEGPWTLRWSGAGLAEGRRAVEVGAAAPMVRIHAEATAQALDPRLSGVEVRDEAQRVCDAEHVALVAPDPKHPGQWVHHTTTWPPYFADFAGRVVTPVAGAWRIGPPVRVPERGRPTLHVAFGGYVLLHLCHPPSAKLGRLTAERVDGGWLGARDADDALGPADGAARDVTDTAGALVEGSLLGPLPPGTHRLRFRLGGIEVGTCDVPVSAGGIAILSLR